MKRFSVILLALVLLVQLTACVTPADTTGEPVLTTDTPTSTTDKPADTTGTPYVTTAPPVTDTKPADQPLAFPSQIEGLKDHYKSNTVEIVYVEGNVNTYTADSIYQAPYSESGAIGDIVGYRNLMIQDAVGARIVVFTGETLSPDQLYSYAKIYFDSQDPHLDIYAGTQYYDMSVATQAHLLDLEKVKNHRGEAIVDLDAEYWPGEYIKEMNSDSATYWVTGELSLHYTVGAYCTFVNPTLYDKFVKSSFDGRSIFDLVKKGDWTVENMLTMASLVYDDTDDSGAASEDDRLGMLFTPGEIFDGFALSTGVTFSNRSTSENVTDSITLSIANDKNGLKLMNHLHTMMNADHSLKTDSSDTARTIFDRGQTLFYFDKLYTADLYNHDDATYYHVLPLPKLDSTQTNYMTGVHDNLTIYGVSRYSNCPQLAAATLELMAYYSHDTLRNEFYNTFLRDCEHEDDVRDMLELMHNTTRTDFVYAWGGSLDNISRIFRDTERPPHSGNSPYIETAKKLADVLAALEVAANAD